MALKQMVASLREMVNEQIEYRSLLVEMTRRDLLLRYKQTFMGFAWAVFMPLMNTAVFSVIFMRVAPLDVGIPYPLFAFCGLLAWNFTASALRFSVVSLTSNQALVTKIYFPREIFPLSAILVCLVDCATASVVLVGLMVYYGVMVGPALLFLPVIVLVQLAFTVGVALLLAMGNLFYRDVKYLFEVVIAVWMFATSVVYPVELVGGRIGSVMRVNPMTPIIEAYRTVLFENRLPSAPEFVSVSIVAFAVLLAGWVAFHHAEFRFAENI